MFDVETILQLVETIYCAGLREEAAEPGLCVSLHSDILCRQEPTAATFGRINPTGRSLPVSGRIAQCKLAISTAFMNLQERALPISGWTRQGEQGDAGDAHAMLPVGAFGRCLELQQRHSAIVASDWLQRWVPAIELIAPYIVNGSNARLLNVPASGRCSIADRYGAGGTRCEPRSRGLEVEGSRLALCVTKRLVKVGAGQSSQMLQATPTRYTNSQNAVREVGFSGLVRRDFASAMEEPISGPRLTDSGIYLEVQRGGWDSQKALQNANPSGHRQFARQHAATIGLRPD